MKQAVAVVLILVCSVFAEPAPETEVRRTLQQFVQAFDNLEWDRFAGFFSDDATIFQPRKFLRRGENKSELEIQFHQIFETIRGNKTKPPYMDLHPLDLKVQMLGEDVAVVSFHLDDKPGVLNRRTIVFHRIKADWKIVHIHASELPLAP